MILWNLSYTLKGPMILQIPWKVALTRTHFALIAKFSSLTNMASKTIIFRLLYLHAGRKINIIFRGWNIQTKKLIKSEHIPLTTGLKLPNKIKMKLITWWGRHTVISLRVNMTLLTELLLKPYVRHTLARNRGTKTKVPISSLPKHNISFKTLTRGIWRKSKVLSKSTWI